MQTTQTPHDQRCIWMNAGVISYKLCDYNFNCDYCPLDIVLRKTTQHAPEPVDPQIGRTVEIELPTDLPEDVARLLRPYAAIRLAEDVLYSAEHLWVRSFNRKLSLVGLDSFLASLLPATASIVLSAQNAHVERGRPFGWVYTHHKALPLLAPLSGTVLRHNRLLSDDLTLVKENNHDLGWLISLLPSDYDSEQPTLLRAAEMRELTSGHMHGLLDRSLMRFRNAACPAGLCLNDGGVPVASLEEALGPDGYQQLIRPYFPATAD